MAELSRVFSLAAKLCLVQILDRRLCSKSHKAVGVLVGHTEGITHLDSKGDGKYVLSNSKDQTAKVWDIRRMVDDQEYQSLPDPKLPQFGWWVPQEWAVHVIITIFGVIGLFR